MREPAPTAISAVRRSPTAAFPGNVPISSTSCAAPRVEDVGDYSDLILSCPPAGQTTARQKVILRSTDTGGSNSYFFIKSAASFSAHLGGWPPSPPCLLPSFATPAQEGGLL